MPERELQNLVSEMEPRFQDATRRFALELVDILEQRYGVRFENNDYANRLRSDDFTPMYPHWIRFIFFHREHEVTCSFTHGGGYICFTVRLKVKDRSWFNYFRIRSSTLAGAFKRLNKAIDEAPKDQQK